jgi:hypothetical protein
MTTSSVPRLIAAGLAATLVLAACGDDAEPPAAAPTTTTVVAPTLAAWVAEFDRIYVEIAGTLTAEMTDESSITSIETSPGPRRPTANPAPRKHPELLVHPVSRTQTG